MAKTKELYWPFECANGHTFDYGPIHHPDKTETDPDTGTSTVAGSGRKKDVPDEVRGCPTCAKDMPLVHAAQVVATPVKDGEAVYKTDG